MEFQILKSEKYIQILGNKVYQLFELQILLLTLIMQIQAWQGEVDSARQAQRDAEKKLASMEA